LAVDWFQAFFPKMNRRPLLCAFFFLASVLSLGAVPLRVLAWNDEIAARKLAISHAKGTEELVGLHPSQRSKVYQVPPGEGAPAVIVALDRKDAEGKPSTSAIKITEGVRKPLLILLPDTKAASGLRLLVLDDDLAGFSWGSIRLVNTTGKPLVFKWDKSLMVVPGAWKPVEVKPGGADRNMQVQLFFHDQADSPVYSAVWEHRDTYRNLVFIVPNEDPRLGAVAFKFLTEDRRVLELENAAAKDR
jgi:hypothetical protein